jgi:chloramphenicol 3-O-phosphotransferase
LADHDGNSTAIARQGHDLRMIGGQATGRTATAREKLGRPARVGGWLGWILRHIGDPRLLALLL